MTEFTMLKTVWGKTTMHRLKTRKPRSQKKTSPESTEASPASPPASPPISLLSHQAQQIPLASSSPQAATAHSSPSLSNVPPSAPNATSRSTNATNTNNTSDIPQQQQLKPGQRPQLQTIRERLAKKVAAQQQHHHHHHHHDSILHDFHLPRSSGTRRRKSTSNLSKAPADGSNGTPRRKKEEAGSSKTNKVETESSELGSSQSDVIQNEGAEGESSWGWARFLQSSTIVVTVLSLLQLVFIGLFLWSSTSSPSVAIIRNNVLLWGKPAQFHGEGVITGPYSESWEFLIQGSTSDPRSGASAAAHAQNMVRIVAGVSLPGERAAYSDPGELDDIAESAAINATRSSHAFIMIFHPRNTTHTTGNHSIGPSWPLYYRYPLSDFAVASSSSSSSTNAFHFRIGSSKFSNLGLDLNLDASEQVHPLLTRSEITEIERFWKHKWWPTGARKEKSGKADETNKIRILDADSDFFSVSVKALIRFEKDMIPYPSSWFLPSLMGPS
ncbi:hypothetical protein HK102_011310, partial [Quaeritorhiza haematococci]